MIEAENISTIKTPPSLTDFPMDVIQFTGSESVDFLQRITTNDFSRFSVGSVQKTLLVTDKGRIFDTVWVIHRQDHLLMLVSQGMAQEIISWMNKYIIMEEIVLEDVTSQYTAELRFDDTKNFNTDYFGFPVTLSVKETLAYVSMFETSADKSASKSAQSDTSLFELWRIENGIPVAKKEIVQDYNPLDLNLWDWISFTKGCYIGQEVIARLDTYKKNQRVLCKISSTSKILEQDFLIDQDGSEIGKITSVIQNGTSYLGLAIIKIKYAIQGRTIKTKSENVDVTIENLFVKDGYGRN